MSEEKSRPGDEQDVPDGAPPSDRDRAVADALANYLDRISQEEFLDIDSFCEEHGSIAQELRPLLHSLNSMDGTFPPLPAANLPEPLPQALSGHRILGEIGAGGMGRVYLAMDDGLKRKIAIKTLNPRFANESAIRSRFMQEARALAQISHPNIVSIFSLGSSEEIPTLLWNMWKALTSSVPLARSVSASELS